MKSFNVSNIIKIGEEKGFRYNSFEYSIKGNYSYTMLCLTIKIFHILIICILILPMVMETRGFIMEMSPLL